MKRLLRRLSRATSSSSSPLLSRHKPSRVGGRCRSYLIPHHPDSARVPAGHLPLRVEDPQASGGGSCRFVVPAELLTAPAIAALLHRSAQEYGYEQSGVLRIPCPVDVFRRVLDSLLLSTQQDGGGEEEEMVRDWCYGDDEEEEQQQRGDLGWPTGLQHGGPECGWCC